MDFRNARPPYRSTDGSMTMFLSRIRLAATWCSPLALLLLFGAMIRAQSSVRSWGALWNDTETPGSKFRRVDAGGDATAFLRADGRIFMQGGNVLGSCEVSPAANGLAYVGVATGSYYTLALLADGTVAGWGSMYIQGSGFTPVTPVIPAAPAGSHYVNLAAGGDHALLLRSDGVLIAFGNNQYGQCNVPAFLTGVVPVQMCAGGGHSMVRLGDGSIAVWGGNQYGQSNAPALPAGLTCRDIAAGEAHSVMLRSDGAIMAWGDNSFGQCNVPSLPPQTSYLLVGAGAAHSVAWRSDGIMVAWGDNKVGQTNVPTVSVGSTCTRIACGFHHTVALLSNDRTVIWGNPAFSQANLPDLPRDPSGAPLARHRHVAIGGHTLCVLSDGSIQGWGNTYFGASAPPPGLNAKYSRVGAGLGFNVALRTDGTLVAWGDNSGGRTTVPPLPGGVVYTDFAVCVTQTVALRSDGQAVGFGTWGWGSIPTPPPGVRYVAVDGDSIHIILLRSDGVVVALGDNTNGQLSVPPAPTGLRYVQLAACMTFNTALQSDGMLRYWGNVPANPAVSLPFPQGWKPLPPLPFGVTYVEISGGSDQIAARRSDGQVVVGGRSAGREDRVPPLDPGTSYLEVTGAIQWTAARVGPTSTYVTFASGCAGTRSAARLVPMDTPKIGATLAINVFDLPLDMAFLVLGWNRTPPVSLAGTGMPGCDAHISVDDFAILTGQGGMATFRLQIPALPSLVGVHFYNQALVLDTGANAAGVVVSNAAEGVVGHS